MFFFFQHFSDWVSSQLVVRYNEAQMYADFFHCSPPEKCVKQGEYKHVWDFNALMREEWLCADIASVGELRQTQKGCKTLNGSSVGF